MFVIEGQIKITTTKTNFSKSEMQAEDHLVINRYYHKKKNLFIISNFHINVKLL
jgi:hypothetical protein